MYTRETDNLQKAKWEGVLQLDRVQTGERGATGQAEPGWIYQGRRAEQLVPADLHLAQIQLVKHDLGHAHEHFLPFQTSVISPHRHLGREWRWIESYLCRTVVFVCQSDW